MAKLALGIVGGMGPLATLDLFDKIIANTDAAKDAEHIRVYIDCHTDIPDRTDAILHGGKSPVPYILESAQKLASIGAKRLLIPCNTSHYFYREIANGSPVPVLNMVRLTAQHLKNAGVRTVGLLATDGTLQTDVYQRELTENGIRTLVPDEAEQREVMRLIYDGVKADAPTFDVSAVSAAVDRLKRAGAEAIVLGCTELPVAFKRYGVSCAEAIDPALILARAAIVEAGYKTRS